MFTITKNCGRCGNLVDFRLKYAGKCGKPAPTERVVAATREARRPVPMSRGEDRGAAVQSYGLAFCPRCNGPALFEFNTYERYLREIIIGMDEEVGHLGGQSLVDVTAVHPAAAEPEADGAWPQEILRLFADAQRMLEQGMTPSIIVSVCRTVLDIATKKLGADESEKILARRIDRLLADGIITKPIADWAHAIRIDGNEAIHEGVGHADDAREYIAFLRMFLNVAFTLPKRIAERAKPG